MSSHEGLEELLGLTGEGFNWDSFDASCEKRSICLSVVHSLVEGALSQAHDPNILKRVVSKAVEENLSACLDAVDLYFVQRADNESQRQSLQQEPELQADCAAIDTWARGVLPVKHVAKTTKTTGQFKSSRSSMIGTPLKKASIIASTPASEDERRKSQASKMRNRDSLKRTNRLVPISDRSNRKKLTQKQVELEQRLRDELEARKTAQEVLREAEANDVEEKKRLQALQQELRGKDYGYDQSGQVVVLNRMDPDRLPPSSVQLKFRFSEKSKRDPEMHQPLANGKRGNESPIKKQASALADAGGLAAKSVPEFVKKTASGLPSMMESMKIVSGVTVKEGDLVKSGPKNDSGAHGMTRSEYLRRRQLDTSGMAEEDTAVSNNTWGENTFNGQEFGILQMIQSAEDPALSGKIASQSQSKIGASARESDLVIQPHEDINLVLTSAPDWGENSPVSAKINLPKPPQKLMKQTINRSPKLTGRLSQENSFNR